MSKGQRREADTPLGQDRDDSDATYLEEIGYRPNTNQIRHEEVPASHHAHQRPLAVIRNEEAAGAAEREGRQHGQAGPARRKSGDQRPRRASQVPNAVPGQPDDEAAPAHGAARD